MRCLFLLLALLLPSSAFAASGLLGGLAIGGHDPVIVVDHGKLVKGFPQHIATSEHMVYYFRAPQNLDIFLNNKEKYTPKFGGNCAFQAAKGKIIAADPNVWTFEAGKLYFFRSDDSRNAWYTNVPKHIAAGEAAWKKYKGE